MFTNFEKSIILNIFKNFVDRDIVNFSDFVPFGKLKNYEI